MREDVARIVVTPDTLQSTPDPRQGGEEAEQAGVRRVALRWAVPVARIEAEEELGVLWMVSIQYLSVVGLGWRMTYP